MNEQSERNYQALREVTGADSSEGGKTGVGRPGATLAQADREQAASGEEAPAVLLDVPNLKVDEISLEVDELGLGAYANVGRIKLDLKGVEGQLMVAVRLGTVAEILNRVLTTIENSPEVLKNLLQPAGEAGKEGRQAGQQPQQQQQSGNGQQKKRAGGNGSQQQGRDAGGDGGGGGARHIIEEVAGEGCTIRRSIDSFGDILEQVLDNDGKVVEEVIVGSVSDLCIVKERTKDGETVRRVRDARTSTPSH